MTSRRIVAGNSPIDGAPIFLIGPPNQDVLATAEKDLIFSSRYYGRRPYNTGSLDLPPWPGLGALYNQFHQPIPGTTDYRVKPWMTTVFFGKTFQKPPDIEFFRYHGDVDSIRLPLAFLGFYHPFAQLFSGANVYYVVRRDHMRIGILYDYSTETGVLQSAYARWHGYAPIHDAAASFPEQIYYSTLGGKLSWVIWDEF